MSEEKVRENRLRRKLERMGYCLMKSRRRDPQAYDYDGYMILDYWTNAVVVGAGSRPFNLSLDDVEVFTQAPTEYMDDQAYQELSEEKEKKLDQDALSEETFAMKIPHEKLYQRATGALAFSALSNSPFFSLDRSLR